MDATDTYMTPDDFLRAITPNMKQPDGKIFWVEKKMARLNLLKSFGCGSSYYVIDSQLTKKNIFLAFLYVRNRHIAFGKKILTIHLYYFLNTSNQVSITFNHANIILMLTVYNQSVLSQITSTIKK